MRSSHRTGTGIEQQIALELRLPGQRDDRCEPRVQVTSPTHPPGAVKPYFLGAADYCVWDLESCLRYWM
ncbi:MAG: hypothetical protein JXR83_00630 [Deltaproteobacteria bacterium]|nr:hypothetical protein [Deltaproteobacteria bacterium]